jgi:hypothetical protein
MNQYKVKNGEDALAYITDCCLATVSYMAMLKRKSKSEFERQISIAQLACSWMEQFGISPKGTRAKEIIGKRTVAEWAKKFTEAK